MSDSNRSRKPQALVATVLVAFVAAGVLSGGKGHAEPNGAAAVVAEVAPIAHRVEGIRELRFKRVPSPQVVTPEQTRRSALADLDSEYPPARRRADAELLELLGLVPPGTDLKAIEGDVSGEQVAGYYDTKRRRLAVVAGDAGQNKVVTEITLAHELNHALEDQRFGIHDTPPSGADDGATAYTALIEGTATAVMDDYVREFIPPGAALASAFSALGPSEQAARTIPPYLQRSLEFSYTGGEQFVNALRQVGHGWKLVNFALRKRPPASTEQIMHPEKYMADERPVRVRIHDPGLGAGWKSSGGGVIGELDTRELLRLGGDYVAAVNAAAGWGGGSYRLWQDAAAAKGCADPCRQAGVVVMRWGWDTPKDTREFDSALPLYIVKGLKGMPAGPARWRVGTGGAAVAVSGPVTTLVLAPSPAEAERIARSAGG